MNQPTRRSPRLLLVIGHGRTDSLCHRLARSLASEASDLGAQCRQHDLLNDGFDPVLRLENHQRHPGVVSETQDPVVHGYQQDVLWADTLCFVHPVWWFAPPALLKGWIDRVLVDGVALEQRDDGPPRGLLEGRSALVVQTFGSNAVVDRALFRGYSAQFWHKVVFGPIGIQRSRRLAFYSVESMNEAKLERACERVRRALRRMIRPQKP